MLISCCCWDTVENNRFDCTRQTVESLKQQVDLSRHRIFFVDNASTDPRTIALLKECESFATVIRNETNLGTARAINKALKCRRPGEHACKTDNDVVVHGSGWADVIETVFQRDPKIGLAGLKRVDLAQKPDANEPWFRSTLHMLPKSPEQPWIVVEQCTDIMGTCVGFNSALLDSVGGLYQMQDLDTKHLYGYEDTLFSYRSIFAGFKNVFIPHIQISHVDNMEKGYMDWKRDSSGKMTALFDKILAEYKSGKRPLFWEDAP